MICPDTFMLPESECLALGGLFSPCDEPPAPILGSCCFNIETDPQCVENVTNDECSQLAGVGMSFRWRACFTCETTPVACFLPPNGCVELPLELCIRMNGHFEEVCVSCPTNPEDSAPCCLPAGGCVLILPSQCAFAGGLSFSGADNCDSIECFNPLGGCCLPTGDCTAETSADCATRGGVFLGSGSDCTTCGVAAADVDRSGMPDVGDVVAILGAWGPCTPDRSCPADLNHDDVVDALDLTIVLRATTQTTGVRGARVP